MITDRYILLLSICLHGAVDQTACFGVCMRRVAMDSSWDMFVEHRLEPFLKMFQS